MQKFCPRKTQGARALRYPRVCVPGICVTVTSSLNIYLSIYLSIDLLLVALIRIKVPRSWVSRGSRQPGHSKKRPKIVPKPAEIDQKQPPGRSRTVQFGFPRHSKVRSAVQVAKSDEFRRFFEHFWGVLKLGVCGCLAQCNAMPQI